MPASLPLNAPGKKVVWLGVPIWVPPTRICVQGGQNSAPPSVTVSWRAMVSRDVLYSALELLGPGASRRRGCRLMCVVFSGDVKACGRRRERDDAPDA